MSTLRTTELRDRVTNSLIPFYRARLTLDGRSNTSTIRDSVGISSVTFISEGSYQVNFISGTFPDEKYAAIGEGVIQNGSGGAIRVQGYVHGAFSAAGAYVRSTANNFTFLTFDMADGVTTDADPPLWVYLVFYY
jgi:hypothetical protein